MITDGVHVHVSNAAAMWRVLVPGARELGDHLRADRAPATRLLVTRPLPAAAVAALLATVPDGRPVTVEDTFGAEPAEAAGATVRRMPVMNRPAGPPDPRNAPDVRVTPVTAADELAVAERIMVESFPMSEFLPLVRGAALPERLLTAPGWQVWLAYLGDRPAAAAYTFDDGVAAGVYWLATLPGFRSRGLARALLATAIAAYPTRVFTLVATAAGIPLYESLGFRTVGTTIWYRSPGAAR
ncbi:hypothetical protein ACWT_4351 [Actinoplanes sp. SE50]|uniref:GNAT family N-acetyltransferase n=1 Tax=unclassified Actinoplanes TaxID=2626549 RepID=UPI00023EC999|nr:MULTISPECIES: GNAT family N-acetyltransferase [unclassified Actinoplanes]AEV85371.1 hypothetical protein ACPL_4480 [Actinoplanes sp. SE50/110]ATO83766.1 hypothetical protein ACWT_4351 [Actinoplanes sp. SE50]SLM01174.1 hypothetical protein ACSP50_4407 [Actinoplanes sp. SE50/110]